MFAFLRVVFDLPARFNPANERLPFELLGNPLHFDGVDLLWPFSINNGQLQLTSGPLGALSGPSYDPFADFDQMALRLRRRFPERSH